MSEPLCVAISDIHFNINNLELATSALVAAINKAEQLDVPLVIAGDLHDTKAIIRAEVMNRLLGILSFPGVDTHILVGNHDLINEKGSDHGLRYLNYVNPRLFVYGQEASAIEVIPGVRFIPYQSLQSDYARALEIVPEGSIIICHQGFLGASMGDYVQDKTSISPDLVKDYRVFSGHYHRRQTIGTVTYLGSPFTHTFGEANDGPKGFLVINKDGTFTREILELRKHVKVEITPETIVEAPVAKPDDLLWVQMSGPKSELVKVNKVELGAKLIGHSNFKLELIPTDSEEQTPETQSVKKEPLDLVYEIIDSLGETDEQKASLKQLTKDLIHE